MKIEEVFKEVRKSVINETNGKQVPWDASCLADDFYFCKSCASKITIIETEEVENYPTNPKEVAIAFLKSYAKKI